MGATKPSYGPWEPIRRGGAMGCGFLPDLVVSASLPSRMGRSVPYGEADGHASTPSSSAPLLPSLRPASSTSSTTRSLVRQVPPSIEGGDSGSKRPKFDQDGAGDIVIEPLLTEDSCDDRPRI